MIPICGLSNVAFLILFIIINMKLVSTAIAMLLSSVSAWDYAKRGADWVDSTAACGTGPQSPIQIPFSLPSREQMWFATQDQYNKIWENVK